MTATDTTIDATLDGSHGGSYSFDPATGTTTLLGRTAPATVSRKAPLTDAAGNPIAATQDTQDTQPGAAAD